jgi:hypothetical protein
MKNIKNIETFLPERTFEKRDMSELLPLKEAIGDGTNLDGKNLSGVKVSDWMWDFGIEKKSFPRASLFYEILKPEEDLSIFTAQLVNTFAVEAWKGIKTKKIFNAAISEKERQAIKSKLRGYWGTKKKLDLYNQEKESLREFIQEFENFLINGELGASIQIDSGSIILSKSADPSAGSMSKVFTSLKSFFTKSTWQKSLAWLINNIANNNQYVKWLNTTIYEPNKITSGINPDVMSAFNSFVVDADLEANVPDMEGAMSAIKTATKLAIEKSKALPEQGRETWMGALYNTHLFGLYQRMLIIGCCAWVYDLIGDTDIMSTKGGIPTPKQETPDDSSSSSSYAGMQEDEYNGVKVYKISYLAPEFKSIISALLSDGQIGQNKHEEYTNRIEARKDSRSIIRSVRNDVLGWGNRHGFRRTEKPDVKGLYTDGSTRIIVPVSMFKKLVG